MKNLILEKAEQIKLGYIDHTYQYFQYTDNGWIVYFSFLPREELDSENVVLGSGYGELDLPYLVAVAFDPDNHFLNENDLIDALLGRRVYHKLLRKLFREKDGLWYYEGGPQNTRLSGVLYFSDIKGRFNDWIKPRLFLNPWAKRPIDLGNVDLEILDFAPQFMHGLNAQFANERGESEPPKTELISSIEKRLE